MCEFMTCATPVHHLRPWFASREPALGESLTMIGMLLGHIQVQTTARYAHHARNSQQSGAARIAAATSKPLFR